MLCGYAFVNGGVTRELIVWCLIKLVLMLCLVLVDVM